MERLIGFSYSDEEVREVVVHLYPRMIAYVLKMLGGRDLSITAEDVFQSAICTFFGEATTDFERQSFGIYRQNCAQ